MRLVDRQILEGLGQAAGPANRGADRALAFPDPEEKLLGVLRQKSGTGLEIFCLAERLCLRFDGDRGADRIAIAFLSTQAEGDGVANILHRVAQDAQLRSVPVFEDHFQPPVVVEVGKDKRPAVVGKIQSDRARDFRKRAVAVVGVENVSLADQPRKNPSGSVR